MREYPQQQQETRGKAALVREQLARLAHEAGPGKKLPTVRQLCSQLGTTPSTLNLALARLEADGVLRRRQGSGIFASETLDRRRIALVCDPSFFGGAGLSPFWGMLIERVQQRAAQNAREEEISLHFTLPRQGDDGDLPGSGSGGRAARLPLHEGLAGAVCEGRLHGVLGIGLPESVAHWLEMAGLPVVGFAGAGPATVGIDYPALIEVLTAALARQGCRRIEMWSPVSPHRPAPPGGLPYGYAAHRDAFARALAAAGLPPFAPDQYRCCGHLLGAAGSVHNVSHVEQGYDTALSVFGPGTPPGARPDGVVVLDDMMTLGALGALQALNLRPGRDVRVATHANAGSPALVGWENRLSVAEVDPARVVDEMFRLLACALECREQTPRHVLIPPQLFLPAPTG